MGHEYRARIAPDAVATFASLFAAGDLQRLVVVFGTQPTTVTLRWRGTPLRATWPEDITVSLHPDGMVVCFHARSAGQKEFLRALETVLRDGRGLVANFEEL